MKLRLFVGQQLFTVTEGKVYMLSIIAVSMIGKTQVARCEVSYPTAATVLIHNTQSTSELYFYTLAGALELLRSKTRKY